VAVLDLNPEGLAPSLTGIRADVTDRDSLEAAMTEVAERLGGLDILVNNAGGLVRRVPIAEIDDAFFDEVVVTDTIPLSPEGHQCPKIRQLSCAQLLAETMTRISNEESVSSLFTD
jgi:ribose-phosphate pyrophosphokinase